MILAQFENLLNRAIGLNAASIGASAVERAVQTRLAACSLQDAQGYWEYVHASAAELQELVETVVIPETWFFRDREAFAAMVGIAQQELPTSHARPALRLLSLPCSTGEEPYSMAMGLFDAGVPAERFRIDAVDISARALTYAERAVYGKNSFRGNDLDFRDRYFASTTAGHHLDDVVRRSVRFQQGNLFDAPVLLGTQVYDVIFCRNLLIYFDFESQERAVGLLALLLSEKGVLFVGPSEAGLLVNRDFVSTRVPFSFAFRKAIAGPRALARVGTKPAGPPCKAPPVGGPIPGTPRTSNLHLPPQGRTDGDQQLSVEEIRRLADEGQLAEAARRCEEYLCVHKPSAAVLHLLGLIRDATGNLLEAADCYRKTLYLEPKHQQALVHLALLLEKQGDAAGAKVLNDRVRRLDRAESEKHA